MRTPLLCAPTSDARALKIAQDRRIQQETSVLCEKLTNTTALSSKKTAGGAQNRNECVSVCTAWVCALNLRIAERVAARISGFDAPRPRPSQLTIWTIFIHFPWTYHEWKMTSTTTIRKSYGNRKLYSLYPDDYPLKNSKLKISPTSQNSPKKSEDINKLIKYIEDNIVGKSSAFLGPFGRRKGNNSFS